MTIHEEEFGKLGDGRRTRVFTLEAGGMRVRILDYGGTIASIEVPDRHGRLGDVVLGFDDLDGFLGAGGYLGSLIGRYGNRIGGSRFALDGVEHRVTANEGGNHLHGGRAGFDKKLWSAAAHETTEGPALALELVSRDGEEGFPGNLNVRVVYTLGHDRGLRIDYAATTDRDTIVNLTSHAYWNLAGHGAGSIADHRMTIDAERFAAVTPGLIPTGELRSVAGTPLDFRAPVAIGARIEADDKQLRLGGGYDHSFDLGGVAKELRRAARVEEPTTGRVLEVLTTEPAVQFYSGNQIENMRGKGGAVYAPRTGFCLETQHHPDSPNRPEFPSTVLRPGERYATTTVYRFSRTD
ncbi:MAG TPA: aldose epimerase family protein [Kofleriaceae bacterium]|nr:aldose epimerase family protein [Kofleriaceae bacterium]